MPHGDGIFSRWPKPVSCNFKIVYAAHKVDAPVAQSRGEGKEVIVPNNDVGETSKLYIRVHTGGHCAAVLSLFCLNHAVLQGYFLHILVPCVQPQSLPGAL